MSRRTRICFWPCHIVFLSLVFLSACDMNNDEKIQSHMDNARQFLAENKLNASSIELKNALKEESNLPEARWMLGEIYLEYKNGVGAYNEFSNARSLGFSDPRMEAYLLRALLLQGKFQEVLEKIGTGIDPAVADILRANAYLGLKNYEKSRANFNKALAAEPASIEAKTGLAQVYLAENNIARAIELVEEVHKQDAEYLDVWILRGDIALLKNQAAEAETAYRQAVSLAGYSVIAQFGLARSLLIQEKIDDAKKPIQAIEKQFPRHPLATFFRGLIALINNDTENAKTRLLQVLKFVPNHAETLLLLSRINFDEGQLEQAKEYISIFIADHPDHLPALKLLSVITLNLQQMDEALDTLNDAMSKADNDEQVMALLGSAYLKRGNLTRGIELMEEATKLNPNVAELHTQLAIGHLMAGQTDIALSALESAIELNPNLVRADILRVLAFISERNYQAAVTAAQSLVEKQPGGPLPYNLVGAAYDGMGDLEKAREFFEKALSIDASFTTAMVNLAKLDLRQNKADSANKRFLDIIKLDKNNVDALVYLARAEASKGNREKMRSMLEQARAANPRSLLSRIVLGEYYLEKGDAENLQKVAAEAQKLAPENPDVILMLGQAQRLNSKPEDSIETLKKLVKLVPDSHKALFQLSITQFEAGDRKASRETLQQLLKLDANHVGALTASAKMALEDRDFKEARDYLSRLRQSKRDPRAAEILQGDIFIAEDKADKAVEVFRNLSKSDKDNVVISRLAQSYRLSGNIKEAIATLEEWLAEDPEDVRARLFLGSLQLQDNNRDMSIREFERVLQTDEENIVALNNLAWLYLKTKPEQALEMARRAHVQLPDRAEILDTLGWVLVQQRKFEEGLRHLETALDIIPGSADIAYHHAAGLIYSGDIDRGRRELEAVLEEHSTFQSRADAKELLDTLQ